MTGPAKRFIPPKNSYGLQGLWLRASAPFYNPVTLWQSHQ